MTLRIRPYRAEDWSAVGRVCVLTGASGEDASGDFVTDELLPYVYAYPYLEYAPDLAWVVADEDDQAIGYIIGVENTDDMADWAATQWLPQYEEALPVDASWTEKDLELRTRGADPSSRLHELRDEYPGEFHIDLLPEAQGSGLGRQLVTTFAKELASRGVTGLAIGVAADNEGAVAFYRRLGFKELRVDGFGDQIYGYLMGLDIPEYLKEQRRRES